MISLTDRKTGEKFKMDPLKIKSIKTSLFGSSVNGRAVREKTVVVRAKRDTAMEIIISGGGFSA